VDLIGGDTTSGPLTLTLQALGLVPKGRALCRHQAKVGDLIYLTGFLGDAGLGLKVVQGYDLEDSQSVLKRFHCPDPRVAIGSIILPYANACIDISDGLLSDLGHVLKKVGWVRIYTGNSCRYHLKSEAIFMKLMIGKCHLMVAMIMSYVLQ
jgi:thiamine-phosphate kinase